MSEQGESEQYNPEQEYLQKAYKPKKKVRDEKDIRYIEQQKKRQQEQKKLYENEEEARKNDPELFKPTQELKMQKEKIKREQLFAKQVINVVNVAVTQIKYELQTKDNQLKYNLKEYKKQIKKQKNYTESKHMQKAGIQFIKRNEDDGEGEQNQEQQQQNNDQEEDKQEVYVSIKYGNIEYSTDPTDSQKIDEPEKGLNFLHQYSCDFQNEFEFDKQTQTILYFTIKLKDSDEKYKQRYNWLKDKYSGDLVIGQGKLDLASLVISKDKEEKREKIIKIWRYDENNPVNKGEEIGNLALNISYKKPEFEKPETKKLKYNFKVDGLSADFSKADTTKLKEKFNQLEQGGDLVPYAKIRIGQQTFKTDLGSGTSVSSSEEYKFNVPQEIQKVYVEVHLYNEVIRFNECVGIAVFPFNKLNPPDPENPSQTEIETDVEAPLSYKGKLAGQVQFKITKYKEMQGKQRQKPQFVDMKEISKPDEFTLKRKHKIEQRHEFHQQRLFELTTAAKKPDPEQSQKDFLTPQVSKKEKVVKLPKLKQTQSSMLIQRPFLDGSEEGTFKRDPIKVQRYIDNKYKQQIHGQGYSSWESASTLQRSVPHFSMPKGARFSAPKSNVPGPNAYSSIGIMEDMQKMDSKLQRRRLKELEEYRQLKRELK